AQHRLRRSRLARPLPAAPEHRMGHPGADPQRLSRGAPLLRRPQQPEQGQDPRAARHPGLAVDEPHTGRPGRTDLRLPERVREVGDERCLMAGATGLTEPLETVPEAAWQPEYPGALSYTRKVTTSTTDPLIGRLIDGRYQVRSRIARGGMATVYLATDLRLERRVAVKVMHGHLADDSQFKQRFIQEARSAARLAHPNVVNVFDQG